MARPKSRLKEKLFNVSTDSPLALHIQFERIYVCTTSYVNNLSHFVCCIYLSTKITYAEIPANLPGQFGQSGQIFLHWAAATLKGLGQFQNKF